MSTTDTRSGFRLPWSSDRSRDDGSPAEAGATTAEPGEVEAPVLSDGSEIRPDDSWPAVDVSARLRDDVIVATASPPSSQEHAPMVDPRGVRNPAPALAPKRPSKLMAELVTAMRSTAEVAREQAQSQVEADARQVVDDIRKGSADGAAALRERSDADVARIREWSKAEIARIREETDRRVTARKTTLEGEIAAHADDIEQRVGRVQAAVAAYEAEMAAFFERLLAEDDPARLATMAESMPEPPSMAEFSVEDATPAWADAAVETEAIAETEAFEAEAIAETEAFEDATIEAEATAAAGEAEAAEAAEAAAWSAAEDAAVELEAAAAAGEAWAEADAEAETPAASAPSAGGGPWGAEDGLTADFASNRWSDPDDEPVAIVDSSAGTDASADADGPRWTSDPDDGTPADPNGSAGSPVDRGSIMAALEAAAEAVVAAEAAAESADQAEAAADVAETAAELIVGRVDTDDETEQGAEAALAARMDAGGFEREPSLADRLASLLPGAGSAEADATPTTTQVVVTGLVSVASIASFKRHLGRAHGVQSVTVASGPDGEFVFNVTHRADTGLRDAIPSLPGFGARVTGTGEGVLHVAARDPEAEG